MVELRWQMTIGSRALRGGAELEITNRARGAQEEVITLRDPSSSETATFAVRGNINIGGKDYLLLHADDEPNDALIAARLVGRERILTMDQDRFSSLLNAFKLYLESRESG